MFGSSSFTALLLNCGEHETIGTKRGILSSDKIFMATSDGLAKVAALLDRSGPATEETLGSDPLWKPRDPLVERLFAREIFGTLSDRKRKLSEDSDSDHGGTGAPDKVDKKFP